jgi:hypothetical protein
MSESVPTHKKSSALPVTKYSIQLNPKAMIFDTPTDARMNFTSSTLPHKRSRYFRDAGTKISVAMNYYGELGVAKKR